MISPRFSPRLAVAVAVACIPLSTGAAAGTADRDPVASRRIFGVTVDDLRRLPAVLDSLRALPRRPWVRVVFDVDRARPADPTPYVAKVGKVRAVAHVPGELVDSSDIPRLTITQTKARAVAYVRALRSVSAWEIGNEINGDWTGKPAVVAPEGAGGVRRGARVRRARGAHAV